MEKLADVVVLDVGLHHTAVDSLTFTAARTKVSALIASLGLQRQDFHE